MGYFLRWLRYSDISESIIQRHLIPSFTLNAVRLVFNGIRSKYNRVHWMRKFLSMQIEHSRLDSHLHLRLRAVKSHFEGAEHIFSFSKS